MIALALVALAIPLTMVIVSVLKFSSKPSTPAPEAPGLRASLEQAAEKALPIPEAITDGRSLYTLSVEPGQLAGRQAGIEKSARSLSGSVLAMPSGKGGCQRVLVQIPASNSGVFESTVLQDFTRSEAGRSEGESRLYELSILSK